MPYTPKTFDELLAALLTDYSNQQVPDAEGNIITPVSGASPLTITIMDANGQVLKTGTSQLPIILVTSDPNGNVTEIDTAEGSLINIRACCTASALWGIEQGILYVSQQIFPDTADSADLDHHGSTYGVPRKSGETDDSYLGRLLNFIQMPPAGGNANDYAQWAESINGVALAVCFPNAQGLGTIDVVVTADPTLTGSQIPSSYGVMTGTASAVQAGKLVDENAAFNTPGTSVAPLDTVTNT